MIRSSLIECAILLAILTGCDPHNELQQQVFSEEQIPCEDRSTEEMNKQYERALQHAEGGSFGLANEQKMMRSKPEKSKLDRLFSDLATSAKQLADQGSSYGMFGYGGILYAKVTMHASTEDQFDRCLAGSQSEMPETLKNDTIVALTYIYVANEKQTWLSHNIKDYIDDIEGKDVRGSNQFTQFSCMQTPSLWIAEAKQNAKKWREHCASKVAQPISGSTN